MRTPLAPLVIQNGESESEELSFQELRHVRSIGIVGPSTLPETVTVQASAVRDPGSGDWGDLMVDGSAVEVGADEAVVISSFPFTALRLQAGENVAGDREFGVSIVEL